MAEIGERLIVDAPGAGFAERHVDADGFVYAHPEHQPPFRLDPEVQAKQEALVARLRGPSKEWAS